MAPRGRREPRMHTGARSNDTYPEREGEGATAAGPQVPTLKAPRERVAGGKRRFGSDFARYRLQLAVTPPKITPEGYRVEGTSLAVQFEGGFYETEDQTIIAMICKSKDYGIGRHVWDAEELRVRAQEKQYDAFVESVAANPELRKRLSADPRLKDFPVEPPKPAA